MIAPSLALAPRTAAALLLSAALAAAGIGIAYWSGHAQDEATSALSRIQRQRAQLTTETEQLRQLQPALQAALAEWKTLVAHGALMPPATAMWSSETSRIFAHQNVDAEAPRFTPSPSVESSSASSNAQILSHSADIDVGLRHEGRLIPLLTALMAMRGAVVLPRACTLTRNDENAVNRLQARCRLDWLTISAPSRNPAR